jgi:hypothetical protein
MKTNRMRKLKIILKGIVLLSIYSLTLTSCLKDDTDEKIAEHNRKMEAMKVTYGISEDEMIGDGIYVHYTYETDTTTIAPVRAVPGDYIVVDLEGYDSDGKIFDVTDSAVAEQENVYNDELVYGPITVNINHA